MNLETMFLKSTLEVLHYTCMVYMTICTKTLKQVFKVICHLVCEIEIHVCDKNGDQLYGASIEI